MDKTSKIIKISGQPFTANKLDKKWLIIFQQNELRKFIKYMEKKR